MKDLVRMSLKVKDIFQLTCKSNSFQTEKLPRASWNFRNVFFMDAMVDKGDATENEHIPPNMPLMKNIYRQKNLTEESKLNQTYFRSAKFNHFGDNLKSFHNPDRVLVVHNHLPLDCLGGACTSFPTTTNIAYLHHHRKTCPSSLKNVCRDQFMNITLRDTSIWRWREAVTRRVNNALSSIGSNQK